MLAIPASPNLVPLRVGDAWVGVPTRHVLEVMGARPLVTVVGAPPLVCGVVSWRRRAVAAVDLRGWLGQAAAAPARERLVVVQREATLFAIQADAVREAAVADVPMLDLDALEAELVRGAHAAAR